MQWIVEGVGAILERELESGIEELKNVTGAVYCDESLQWVAWYWISKAALEVGALEMAQEAGGEALKLAESLDGESRGVSRRNLGDLAISVGDHDAARVHLEAAAELFAGLGDDHGRAMTWLTRARMEALGGRLVEARQAAVEAQGADPSWQEPGLFLTRQALVAGDAEAAAGFLAPLVERDPPLADVQREMSLVELVRSGRVSVEVMGAFCRLRENPPSGAVVEQLMALVEREPEFLSLREHLAWQLLKMGRDDEARGYFDHLSSLMLDSALQSSVLLGLGCLANRRHRHERIGARLHKAAEAGRPSSEHPAVAVATPPAEEQRNRVKDATSSGLRAISALEEVEAESLDVGEEVEALPEIEAFPDMETLNDGEMLPDLDPSAFAGAQEQVTRQQTAIDREELLSGLEQTSSIPEASLDFTLWAEPDDGDDISPDEVGGASTMRLSNDLLDSLTGQSGGGELGGGGDLAIPRTDSGAIRFDVPSSMPAVRQEEKPSGEGSGDVRGGAKAAFTGDLQLLAVPDLLDFLKNSRRTGTLVVTSEAG
ncbi:MAG: DUF4388 domain-containing protein, partial [Deltaproteobacteria bacterium]|nr:DUF4388 domain-containing protein [Deltaproteobacteria bacterium]